VRRAADAGGAAFARQAAEALAVSAREHDADEIAIGSRGLGKLRATLGSVSHDVLHEADRPVIVIPSSA
jgi:nucleotide-binding universal stress UspA family protein